MFVGNVYTSDRKDIESVPFTLDEAAEIFHKSEFVKQNLGERSHHVMYHIFRNEIA